ncbi:MAG TPA: tetratricopeptide repeat protein [Candidatus Bathyarchaeia archaeon]|nr:tetratricopeptide repeat protein [Candidatus Bathyarchaeia archaeon]
MSGLQLTLIVALAAPTLGLVLWPLLGGRAGEAPAVAPARLDDDRRLELEEEKTALYRALRELEFDHDSGHLSDADHASLRERYESRAAALITELDALGPAPPGAEPAAPSSAPAAAGAARTPWTRQPIALTAGAALLVVFGVVIGINAGRYTQPDESMTPPGARLPVPAPDVSPIGPPKMALEPGKPIPPELLAGMLRAARQSLFEGRYSEAIAAYQAVLKRDPKNVDALTHLALIVAIGGHADTALETIDKALAIDPRYAPAYLYRGQVLYEQKQDYPGAVKAWQQFLVLVPQGEDHDRVAALVETARSKQPR